jgi:hypothetical protein
MQSINAAIGKSRTTGAKGVMLREGVYRESGTIVLSPADSGLTITSYNQEKAVISGAVPINPTWTRFNDTADTHNIWVTPIPCIHEPHCNWAARRQPTGNTCTISKRATREESESLGVRAPMQQ